MKNRNTSSKIKTILTTFALIFILHNAQSQSTEEGVDIYEKIIIFDSLYSTREYLDAFKYAPDIIDFYIKTEQYDKCIELCNSVINIDSTTYTPLNSYIGECLYYKRDLRNAEPYLRDYIKDSQKNEYYIDPYYVYYVGLYVNILYDTHKYSDAIEYYKLFFNLICDEEGLDMDELPNSEYNSRDYIGRKLYNYAYCHFFLGEETQGLDLLKISANCNYEDAIDDYSILKRSRTFGKDIKDINWTRKAKKSIRQYSWEFSAYDSLGKSRKNYFWDNVSANCYELQELLYAINKNRIPGTLRGVLKEFNEDKISSEIHLEYLNPYETSEFESELRERLCEQNDFLNELRVFNAQDPNAFATPWGQIYLTDALVYKYHFNKELLLAVCAHEAAHYICQHAITHSWAQAKKERNNEIWAGVAVGVNSAAHATSSIYASSSGVKYDDEYWEDVTEINNSLIDAFQENTYYYQFKYSRRQEIEADILAYRFCEYIGIGGYAYIMALELLGDNTNSTATSDHPSNALRIGILKNIYKKEVLTPKKRK